MYRTSQGDRILLPAEAKLVATALRMMADFLKEMELAMGVSALDDLQRNQQIVLFHAVARALFCADEPAPQLTACVEAAVGSVYQHIRDELEVEIEEEPILNIRPTWRELVLAASREAELELGELPAEDCDDKAEWTLLVDCLQDRVLWDEDWQLEGSMDLDPEASQRLKDTLGIAEDYFVTVPPDPPDAEAERLLRQLIELTDAVKAQGGDGK